MLDFDPAALAPYFSWAQANVSLSPTKPVLLAQANANRILLLISSIGFEFWFAPGPIQFPSQGIHMPASGSPFLIKWADWGGVTGNEWWAPTSASGGSVGVTQVLYYPRGE